MKTILLTGVAGFIANRTGHFLLDEGYKVIGVDNLNDYYDVKIKHHRLDSIKDRENFTFHQLDIEDYSALEKLFKTYEFDAVLNLAARAGVRYSLENPHIYMTTNANATLNLLELMRHNNVKKMVLASTSSLYAGQPMPFLEDLPVNTPISPYAASKKAAEMMCYSYAYQYDLDITVVRYFTVYGPAGRPDMSIFRFVKWIDDETPIELFGDGTQARDFTYIDDIARGTIAAMKPLGFEVINLGGGNNPVSINYTIEFAEKYLGKTAKIENKPFHKADIMETWANIDKAKNLLNWEPQVSLDDGLTRTLEWYTKNKHWLKDVEL